MGKYTRSAKQNAKRQRLIIGVVSAVILGLIAVSVLAKGGLDSGQDAAELLITNRVVDVREAYQLHQQDVYTLDVRTPEEFQDGHIPGAASIPLEELAFRTGELPEGEPILIYCRSGNRSQQALDLLESVGFQGLTSLDGGINEWAGAGYPLEYP